MPFTSDSLRWELNKENRRKKGKDKALKRSIGRCLSSLASHYGRCTGFFTTYGWKILGEGPVDCSSSLLVRLTNWIPRNPHNCTQTIFRFKKGVAGKNLVLGKGPSPKRRGRSQCDRRVISWNGGNCLNQRITSEHHYLKFHFQSFSIYMRLKVLKVGSYQLLCFR